MATALVGSRGINSSICTKSERFMVTPEGISETGGCPHVSWSRVPLPLFCLVHNRLVGQEQRNGKGPTWNSVLFFSCLSADLVKGPGQYGIQPFFEGMNMSKLLYNFILIHLTFRGWSPCGIVSAGDTWDEKCFFFFSIYSTFLE